jgi:hypothetical protein
MEINSTKPSSPRIHRSDQRIVPANPSFPPTHRSHQPIVPVPGADAPWLRAVAPSGAVRHPVEYKTLLAENIPFA